MKERIVGAFVLFCAGVLLWMVLFPDVSNREEIDRTTQIPPQMVVDKPNYTRPSRPQGISDAKDIQQQYAEQRAADEEQDKNRADKQAADEARQKAASKPVAKVTTPVEKPIVEAPAKSEVRPTPNKVNPETKLPDAWVIQVATFGQRENAERFTNKLQDAGYKAYFKRVEGKKGDLFQVLVGPKLSLSLAEADKAQIEKRFKVKTIISRFVR